MSRMRPLVQAWAQEELEAERWSSHEPAQGLQEGLGAKIKVVHPAPSGEGRRALQWLP